MRLGAIVPVLVAAIAMFGIGFLIYGLLFEDLWVRLSGLSAAEAEAGMGRMWLSPVMPLLLAVGLSTVYRWTNVHRLGQALHVSVWLWLCFVFPVLLYGFAYSREHPGLLLMDAIHLLLNLLVGGAIIAAWPKGRTATVAAA